jgi:hypothetical protein
LDSWKEEDLLSCPTPIHWVPEAVTGGTTAQLDADPSPPRDVEVKKEWRYTSPPPPRYFFMACTVMLYLFECFSVHCIPPIAESGDCFVLRTAMSEVTRGLQFQA